MRTKRTAAFLALLAALVMISACGIRTNVSSMAAPGQAAKLQPPASFYVQVTAVPEGSALDDLWDDFMATLSGGPKPPPLEQVVADKVRRALVFKGLKPLPAPRAQLKVLAAFDLKSDTRLEIESVYNEKTKKVESVTVEKTRYDYWLRIMVSGNSGAGILWQGETSYTSDSRDPRGTLNYLIAAVMSRWGISSRGRDAVEIKDDDPLVKLLERTN